ncbi:MAG: iron complex outermembrane receptor protein [Colwellia sp.]|jgi:iron complex outermembrane receptor protein
MMFRKNKLALIVSAAYITAPLAVFAEEVPQVAEEKFKVERIQVTASRRSESLSSVPYNISALNGADLEKAGITDFTKLTRNIPGLVFSDTGPRNNGISGGLIMRGMNAQPGGFEDFYRSSDPAVSTYIGETPLFVNLNMRDINRVEVLRGPQGTLYGSGSLGGTIRYIQNDASLDGFDAHFSTKLAKSQESGGFNTDTEFMVNLPLSDNLAVRFVGAYVDNAGFIDADRVEALDTEGQPTGETFSKKDINDNQVKYGRFALSWDVSDEVFVDFNYQVQSDEVAGRQAVSRNIGDYTSGTKQLEPFSGDVQVASLDIEADLGFATITSSSSLYKNEADSSYDQSYNYPAQGFWAFYAGLPRDTVTGIKTYRTDAFIQELRLVSNHSDDYEWVAGLYMNSWHGSSTAEDYTRGLNAFLGTTNPQAKDLNYSNVQKDSFTDKAIFGELTYHVSDDWQMTFGARFFDQEFESSQRVTLPTCGVYCGEGDLGLSEASVKQSFKDQIFKFNTSYKMNDDLMAYATVSEGFRHGGSNGLPIDDPSTPAKEGGVYANDAVLGTYQPDKATNFETGVKGFTFDEHLEFTAAVFFIDWEDNQVLQRSPEGGFPIVYNLGKSETTGFEFESKWRFTQNLSVSLGYAYVLAEIAEDFDGLPNISGESTISIKKGARLPGVPEHTLTSALDYSFVTESDLDFSLHLGGFYKGGFETDLTKDSLYYDEVDSQVIFDASATMFVGQWQFSFFIDNLLNTDVSTLELGDAYYKNYAGQVDPEKRLVNGDVSYIVRPRTVGLGVKYVF